MCEKILRALEEVMGLTMIVLVFSAVLGAIAALFMWATKGAPVGEMTCYRNGVEITTTMRELRKPGPYVIGETSTGRIIAIANDGIRSNKVN